jgi:hypothetical protein
MENTKTHGGQIIKFNYLLPHGKQKFSNREKNQKNGERKGE